MPTMAIMIGIQASGKSRFCAEKLAGYVRVNLDTLHPRNKENMAIEDAISRQVDLVIDNTNPTVDDRAKYICRARAAGYKVVGYFVQSKLQDCIARNELREGKAKVPRTAIANTSNKLEMPSCAEGFDELYFVSIVDDAINIDEWRDPE